MNGNRRTRQILRITFRRAENGKTEQGHRRAGQPNSCGNIGKISNSVAYWLRYLAFVQ